MDTREDWRCDNQPAGSTISILAYHALVTHTMLRLHLYKFTCPARLPGILTICIIPNAAWFTKLMQALNSRLTN